MITQNNLDKNYWATRYQQNQTGWDIGFCSTPLQEYFDQLTNKELKILIPGAGYAHEAKYLHELGFSQVNVIDLALEPLTHLKEICPEFPESHLILGDFFEHDGQYDLIVEQTFFCAIDPGLREAYVQKMKFLLQPKGKLVGVLFNRDFEGGPPFGGCVEDYRLLFEKHFDAVNMEACYNSIEPRNGNEVFIRVS
jgi:SAM-dependent methyltransferase